MIIYGTRATHQKSIILERENCTHCNTKGTVLLSVFAKYAHVFWIPFFPLGRRAVSQCQHCKHVLETSQMPQDYKNYYETIKAEIKVPIWQFAGLAVVALIIIFSVYSSGETRKNTELYAASPVTKDKYEIKTESSSYTYYLVDEVRGDSVVFSVNQYEVTKASGLYKLDIPQNYIPGVLVYSKADIKGMLADGTIREIIRN
jgi:hypothetical protein